ncbi:two-component system heavy metal sensor histidine kinase CusS [Acidovorax soli]|uniref:Sensor protein n=1 Tax=Acidovorax soli TaxID=592050 RepID=A0A7X0PBA7_9BURK|nr:heavy metal sensor histidine kinase [Acidovorax soli]MBB6558728.1 two-component system heavy metal sensor histidine kinase CusS [Acidovorax soli]
MSAPYSLTTRLTVFFTLASAFVLIGLGTLVAISIDRHFVELDRDALRDKIHLMREVIGKSKSPQDLQTRMDDVLHSHEGLFVSVTRGSEALYSTPGFEFPGGMPEMVRGARLGVAAWHAGTREVRGMYEVLSAPGGGDLPLQVSVALDIAHHKHFMHDLIRVLAVYVALATLVAGVLGWWAARNGLAPLRAMRSRAMAITAKRLDERMPSQEFPIEMADLATTLNEMLRRLKEDFDRLSEFSSDLAHELRTPINNLMTQTQVTLGQSRSADQYRDILASNAEEYQRLARMVADMLFLAKADHGLILPSTEKIAVHAEAQALFDFYEALAEEKQVQLKLLGAAEISGDQLMLRRALSNLLSNAVRYTPAGESVVVEISGDVHGTTVDVINHGPTIDAQMIPRLFDRFFRADKSRKQLDSDGAGLGLSITQAIVQAHRGRMSVSSESGRTCFSMFFPSTHSVGKHQTTNA